MGAGNESGHKASRALGLVAVVVRDYDEALSFYLNVLGFHLVEDTPVPAQGKRWVVVTPGAMGARVLLAKATSDDQFSRVGNQTGGRVFLFLYTDNCLRDHAELSAKGVKFVRQPERQAHGVVAVFADLYGNLWDLIEPNGANRSWDAALTRPNAARHTGSLIVFTGLPAVGKTTIARLVAKRLQAAYVRIDSIEQTLVRNKPDHVIGPEGYLVAYDLASDNLALGIPVVADCVNASEEPRLAWRSVAARAGARLLFVFVACSDSAEHQRRVHARVADLPGHVLPPWATIGSMQVDPPPPDALVLDTAQLAALDAADLVIEHAS